MTSRKAYFAMALGIFLVASLLALAQDSASQNTPPATVAPVTADYPHNQTGVLIRDRDWERLPSQLPAKSHVKHGAAPAQTDGTAPPQAVSDYKGMHAKLLIGPGRPVICVCYVKELPGTPALVTLHPNPEENFRELNGGNLHIWRKLEEAQTSDLIPINISHPENTVWLVQPQRELPPGEYAVMLGTQNLSIFPFSVAAIGPGSPADTDTRYH